VGPNQRKEKQRQESSDEGVELHMREKDENENRFLGFKALLTTRHRIPIIKSTSWCTKFVEEEPDFNVKEAKEDLGAGSIDRLRLRKIVLIAKR